MDIFSIYILSVATSSLMLNANYRLIEEKLKKEQFIEKNEKFSQYQKFKNLIIVLTPGANILYAIKQVATNEKIYKEKKVEIIENIQKERIRVEKNEKESEKVIKLRDKIKVMQQNENNKLKKKEK